MRQYIPVNLFDNVMKKGIWESWCWNYSLIVQIILSFGMEIYRKTSLCINRKKHNRSCMSNHNFISQLEPKCQIIQFNVISIRVTLFVNNIQSINIRR